MIGVAEGAGGGVVTGEEEQFDLRRSLSDERIGGGRIGGCHQVTLENEVDDVFRVGFGTVCSGLPVAVALRDLGDQVAIHPPGIVPVEYWAEWVR